MKKIIFFITVCLVFFSLGFCSSINAASKLSAKLDRVEINQDNLKLTITLQNDSSYSYSYGWTGGGYLYVTTDNGNYSTSINSAKNRIIQGTNKLTLTVNNASGTIKSVKIAGIRQLDSSGLPVNNVESFNMSVDISSYTLLDNVANYTYNLILIAAITITSIIICMIIIRKHNKFFAFGRGLQIGAAILLIYAGINYITKPKVEDTDFMNVSQSYWILLVVAAILLSLGGFLTSKNKKINKTSNYNLQNHFNQQMFNEQNRLFNEQVQRNQQEQFRQIDEQNQQQFNDFNNNNFNNF